MIRSMDAIYGYRVIYGSTFETKPALAAPLSVDDARPDQFPPTHSSAKAQTIVAQREVFVMKEGG